MIKTVSDQWGQLDGKDDEVCEIRCDFSFLIHSLSCMLNFEGVRKYTQPVINIHGYQHPGVGGRLCPRCCLTTDILSLVLLQLPDSYADGVICFSFRGITRCEGC